MLGVNKDWFKEKMGKSGAMRPIAQPGETPKKGMVSSKTWNMLQSLFGGDIAVVPPKRLLASASGGMSAAKAKKLAAELKKKTSPRSCDPRRPTP